jgi:hypothetical protein
MSEEMADISRFGASMPDQRHQTAALQWVMGQLFHVRPRNKMSECELEAQGVRMEKSQVKTMLTAFFSANGILHQKQTVKAKMYKEAIQRFNSSRPACR